MSTILKRSDKSDRIPHECQYGCCTPVHGKNIKNVRRSIKRSQKQQLARDINNGEF